MQVASRPLSNTKRNLQSGFSLIEATIVVAITIVLCALAIPQIISSTRSNRLNTTAALVAAKMAEARIEAIKRNAPVSFVVNLQQRRMWIEAAGTMIGASETYPAEMQMQFDPSVSSVQETVTFNSFGNLTTQPVAVGATNTAAKLKKNVRVSLSGKITVDPMTTVAQ